MRYRVAIVAAALVMLPQLAAAEWGAGFQGSGDYGYTWITWSTPVDLVQGQRSVFWTTASYQYYRVSELGGTTQVRAPGLGAGVTFFWNPSPDTAISFGPGYEYRWITRDLAGGGEIDDAQGGVVLQGTIDHRLLERTFIGGGVSYLGATEWRAARASLRQQIGEGLRIGPEVSFQGNDDVEVHELGAIAELPQGRNWIYVRAGQATEKHRGGFEETRPYFSVGVARSF
jgi:hypothetical protein